MEKRNVNIGRYFRRLAYLLYVSLNLPNVSLLKSVIVSFTLLGAFQLLQTPCYATGKSNAADLAEKASASPTAINTLPFIDRTVPDKTQTATFSMG